jgi:hypothetical protein
MLFCVLRRVKVENLVILDATQSRTVSQIIWIHTLATSCCIKRFAHLPPPSNCYPFSTTNHRETGRNAADRRLADLRMLSLRPARK